VDACEEAAVSTTTYQRLEDIVSDALFPEVDLQLRRGRHVTRDDVDAYEFLEETLPFLEDLYARYGCDLVHADAYFYLRPTGDRMGRRHLGVGEMVVGQALALLYLDPATTRAAGTTTRSQLIELVISVVGQARLVVSLNPRRRRHHEHVAQDAARRELDRALRSLDALGFVEMLDEERLRIRPSVMRFAEPVRGLGDRSEALRVLIAKGEVAFAEAKDEADEEDPT
jgi:chromosome partition protein MukE